MIDVDDYDFTFTKEYAVDSEAVGRAFYNAAERYVVVTLGGGTYRYDDVEQSFADSIDNVYSVGRSWLPTLKSAYGPGTYLGEFRDLDFEDLNALSDDSDDEVIRKGDRIRVKQTFQGLFDTYEAGTLGTASDDAYGNGFNTFISGVVLDDGRTLPGGWFASRFEKIADEVGPEPELLTEAPENDYIPLKSVSDNFGLRKFVVAFESEVGNMKDYTLFEKDWNSAVQSVVELGESLGLEFNVKGVSVLD